MLKRNLYLSKLRPFYHSELIKVLIGIRRSGKSVLLRQIIEELIASGIEEEQIIYINFENMEYSFIQNAMDLHNYIKDKMAGTKKYYLFFDEIQIVHEFERAVNSFRAAFDCSIFITGSNGKLLSGELATYLSGRYVSFNIMPFSFKEVCEFKEISREQVTEEVFMDYLNWGGMPQRFLMNSENEVRVYMNDLYNSIVLRDIIQRSKARDVELLNRIVEYMVMNTSQTFSASSIARYFESVNRKVSTDTVYQYVEYIVSSLIMHRVRRYDIRGKRVLTRSDKYYLTDMGISKINNTGFKTELGPLMENVVYNELLVRGYEVFVGKPDKGEIDFIAVKDGNKEYYQVAYLLPDKKVVDREFGAYAGIEDNYPKFVLSMDKFDFSSNGIIHKNIIDFLLSKES